MAIWEMDEPAQRRRRGRCVRSLHGLARPPAYSGLRFLELWLGASVSPPTDARLHKLKLLRQNSAISENRLRFD